MSAAVCCAVYLPPLLSRHIIRSEGRYTDLGSVKTNTAKVAVRYSKLSTGSSH